jgi:hypothetical protein
MPHAAANALVLQQREEEMLGQSRISFYRWRIVEDACRQQANSADELRS